MSKQYPTAIEIVDGFEGDPVNHPAHYRNHPSGIEVIQITEHETFLRGNILKYVFRAPYKGNELQDLEKAQWYLSRELDRVRKAAR